MSYNYKCKGCKKTVYYKYKSQAGTTGYCRSCVASKHVHKSKNVINDKGEKLCTSCNIYLEKTELTKTNRIKDVVSFCKKCNTIRKYGINRFDYNLLLIKQNHQCAICGDKEKTKDLVVDHCHKTGTVRGLLCGTCNIGLGNFKDDENKLWKAIIYLKRKKQ